jgi:hypothetical protein
MKSKKIAECILELTGTQVSLDSENKYGGNYKYASLPHLQSVVLPVVKKHRLILTQTVIDVQVQKEMVKVQKKAGEPPLDKLMTFAHCQVKTELFDPEADESIECLVYGDKVDQSSDKSLGAHTIARRYGIMTLFNLIVTDDDLSDPDGSSDVRNQLGVAPTNAQRKAQAQPSSSSTLQNILGI